MASVQNAQIIKECKDQEKIENKVSNVALINVKSMRSLSEEVE